MPVRYDGFSAVEQANMERAFTKMRTASAEAKRALAANQLDMYKKWFEKNGTTQLKKVTSIVNGVDQAILQRPITFAKLDRPGVNANTENLCGYVFLIRTGQNTVAHFGSGMRIMVVYSTHASQSTEYLAQTMYHELTHKVGTTQDHSYNETVCAGYAVNLPATAASNAENYDLFLNEYM